MHTTLEALGAGVLTLPLVDRGRLLDRLIARIAARCGAALVVARQDTASVAAPQDLMANLAETPAKLAGVVFNEF